MGLLHFLIPLTPVQLEVTGGAGESIWAIMHKYYTDKCCAAAPTSAVLATRQGEATALGSRCWRVVVEVSQLFL